MVEIDESLAWIMAEAMALCPINSKRHFALSALDALRAAGYTINPPGSIVIPPLDTKAGQKVLKAAQDILRIETEDGVYPSLQVVELALRAAGKRG